MKNLSLRSLFSLLLFVSFVTATLPSVGYAQTGAAVGASTSSYEKGLAAIEAKVEARRKELGIPGMSLVIVHEDKVIFAKGLGYKDFENKIAVTPDTQFAIGSATKAFTALSVLMTADEGKLSLDDSPKKLLPYFKMYDAETDKNITIRDLMCHSSGLNRTDLAMITGKLTRAELIQVAAQAKPTAKLREKFQYQNIMFAAAGELVTQAQKQAWEMFVPERIFKPLAMNNSTMLIREMEKAKDFSRGYDYNFDTKETVKREFREIEQVAPAGSINSSANDMAQWLRFVLNGGTVDGKRLISEKGFEEWLKPQMKMNAAGTVSYGLGWFLQKWNGHTVVQHGGNIDGFNSLVGMIPEKKIGFVMLTNVSGSSMGSDIMPVIWSNILGDPKTDAVKPPATGDAQTVKPAATTSAAAKELVGQYKGPGGGTIEIRDDAGKVTFNIPGQQPYALADKAKDSYTMAPLPEAYWLTAKRDAAGKVTSVVVTQPEGEFEFKRTEAKPAEKPTITGEELMLKAVEASGGEENQRKITTRVMEADIDLENQGVQGKTLSWLKAPNKTATEMTMTALGKKIASGWEFFNGTGGEEVYSFAPLDKYTGKRLDDVALGADFYGQLDWKKLYKKVSVTRTAKVGDDECYVVEIEPVRGSAFTEFYSTKTFLLRKREGVIASSTSEQKIPYSITFDDYRAVDGVVLAHKMTNFNIGNGNIVTTVRSYKHNVPVDDKIFASRKLN